MKKTLLLAAGLSACAAANAAITIAEWNNFGAIAGAGTNPTSFTNVGTGYVDANGWLDLSAGIEARGASAGVAGTNQAYTTLGGNISMTNGTTAWAVAMKVSDLAAGNNTLFTLSTTSYAGIMGLSVNTTTGTLNFGNFGDTRPVAISGWATNYTAGQELTFSFYRTAAGVISGVIHGLAGGDVTVASGLTGVNYSGKVLTNLYLGTSVNPQTTSYATYNTTNFPVDNSFNVIQAAVLTGDMTTADLANPFTLTAIPEPSTYGLLGAGALAAAALVRRRRKAA